MKRFTFRLETLLRHRRNLEEKERNELYRLRALYQNEANNLQNLHTKQLATLRELAEKRSASADHAEIGWFYTYLDRLRFEMDQVRQRLLQIDKQIQRQKIVVIEATKRKKVLDTLKAKKQRQYTSELEKEEQKAIDEIVVIRYPQKAH